MITERQKILKTIEEDEYFQTLNKFIKKTLHIIDILDVGNKNCTFENFEMVCLQSKMNITNCLSDLLKLTFLGYVTITETNSGLEYYSLGSKKIDYLVKNKNHLKLWLNSKVNSIKGEDYLKKYKGQTIEEIFKKDPEYITEKILEGNFILSLSSIEILEKKYSYKFTTKLKELLKIVNEEYSFKNQILKSTKINNPDLNNDAEKKLNDKINFLDFLKNNNYPFKTDNERIIILSDFYWESSSDLIENLTINGNLKISNFLEYPKIIPRALKVGGYIQFGGFEYLESHTFDVWMKLE